jgi:hypothetical protein
VPHVTGDQQPGSSQTVSMLFTSLQSGQPKIMNPE